jgi:hypothetical protein
MNETVTVTEEKVEAIVHCQVRNLDYSPSFAPGLREKCLAASLG